jgi:glutamine synthetase
MKKGRKKAGAKNSTRKTAREKSAKTSLKKKTAKRRQAISRRAKSVSPQKTPAVSIRISKQEDRMTPKDVLSLAKEKKAVMVDFKFMDYPGLWQHFSTPVSELSEALFEDGLGFDGSSIRGWQAIHASDMLVVPDAETAVMDPFTKYPTLSLICNIVDPITKERYSRDPRHIAQKAEAYLKSTGIGDTCYMGPEPEFFIFDDVRFDQNSHEGYYHVDSVEGIWNSGRVENPNLGYKPRHKEGYFPVPPIDSQEDIRTEMVEEMQNVGIYVEKQHHEVATAGQAEIDMRFNPLVKMADQLMYFKYIIKNVAKRHNKTVTFMPKPLFGDNGSGMHTHQSIWKGGKPLFAGDKYAGMSQLALNYIGGILKHAKVIAAFTNPTTNSYKRLTPGFEAPVNLAYSSRNRSASIRIPMYSPSPKSKRIEVRFPDPSCNPYLAFAAMMMAGLDGIENKIDPGQPLDKDIYDMAPEELASVPSMPGSLDEALNNLEADHNFLMKGDVFTKDAIEMWISYKRSKEVDALRLRPHPYEFFLYYDL